jgi:hypothetical protein
MNRRTHSALLTYAALSEFAAHDHVLLNSEVTASLRQLTATRRRPTAAWN